MENQGNARKEGGIQANIRDLLAKVRAPRWIILIFLRDISATGVGVRNQDSREANFPAR